MRQRGTVLFIALFTAGAATSQTLPTLDWPVVAPRITQDYACKGCVTSGYHSGIDMTDATVGSCTSQGPLVLSAADGGTVVRTQDNCGSGTKTTCTQNCCQRGFGNHVIVQHSNPFNPQQDFYLVYAHLSKLSVSENQEIDKGDEIGVMGDTGVNQCHLHFDVVNTDFDEKLLGEFVFPSEPSTMGYLAYPSKHPADDCDPANTPTIPELCLDPKSYFPHDEIGAGNTGGGTQEVYENPDGNSSKCVTEVNSGQAYVSIARQGPWHYIMLPSDDIDAGPRGNPTCTTDAPFGWINPAGFPPTKGYEVRVKGPERQGVGLNVREDPTKASSALTRVWPGNYYWSSGQYRPGGGTTGCSLQWVELYLPELRSSIGGVDRGWACSDYLEIEAGQCFPPPYSPLGGSPSTCGQCVVTTEKASAVTPASASLNMTINPNGASTTAWFRYEKNDPTPDIETQHVSIGSGTNAIPFSLSVSGLDCESTYYYQAVGANAFGEAAGTIGSFLTGECGGGETEIELLDNGSFEQGLTSWQRTSDFYVGTAPNPRGGSWYAFLADPQWNPGNNLIGTLKSDPLTIPGNATRVELSFWYSISTQETLAAEFDKLHIWIQDTSGGVLHTFDNLSNLDDTSGSYVKWSEDVPASIWGENVQLTFVGQTDGSNPTVFRLDDASIEAEVPAGGAPSVTTDQVDQVTSSTARLHMTVNPSGLQTDAWFDFEANDPTPNEETIHIDVGSGTTSLAASISVFDLDCDTTYYYEANASNSAGNDDGSTKSFSTDDCEGGAPKADTDPAGSIARTSAELRGDIFPNGVSTTAWYEWGTTASLGNETTHQSVGSGTSWVDFPEPLQGLVCGTEYHFRAHAENNLGEDNGVTYSFETDDCAPPTPGEFLLWSQEQTCDNGDPAVLLLWSPAEGATGTYTVQRTDNGYTATVDADVEGRRHLVSGGMGYNESYTFVVTAQTSSGTEVSNPTTVYVVNHACLGGGAAPELPGAFTKWNEPYSCEGGQIAVPIRWSTSPGAESYALDRLSATPGQPLYVPNLQGTSYVDVTGLIPGVPNAYEIEAHNASGITETSPVASLVLLPPPVCGGTGLPGPFTLSASVPFCDAGKPAIPISWTPSAGADDVYHYRVYNEVKNGGAGSGNTAKLGFSKDVTAGVIAGQKHEIFMIAEDPDDETKVAFSNSIFTEVPIDVCAPPSDPPDTSAWTPVRVDSASAVIRAGVRPNGSPTTAWFEWGGTASYGQQTSPVNIGDGTIYQHPGAVLTGLQCETEYHYRVVAANPHGISLEVDSTFTTGTCIGQPPQVATDPGAANISETQATVSGSVNPNGVATTASFDYGTTPGLGATASAGSAGSGISSVPIQATLTSLTCGRGYYFQASATSSAGSAFGQAKTFSTDPCCNGEHLVQGLLVETQYSVEACESIMVLSSTIEAPGVLLLRAGQQVTIGNGFSVEAGADLTVEIDPSLRP